MHGRKPVSGKERVIHVLHLVCHSPHWRNLGGLSVTCSKTKEIWNSGVARIGVHLSSLKVCVLLFLNPGTSDQMFVLISNKLSKIPWLDTVLSAAATPQRGLLVHYLPVLHSKRSGESMWKLRQIWSPQEQTSTSNHQCPYLIACLRKGSENPIPLAQPLLHRAEQSNLMSFITSLENNWIWVFLSCNEHVSVSKTIVFFPSIQNCELCQHLFWGGGKEEYGSQDREQWVREQDSNRQVAGTHLLEGVLVVYWSEEKYWFTGLSHKPYRQRKSLSLSTHKEEHAVLSGLWSSKGLYRKDSCPVLLCRILSKEPQVGCRHPETKYCL